MSANFYELLKYAATGIASPDMTYFDRMRASTLMGGVVQTLTGIPPLSFKADGTPLISLMMKGNGQQTGTPSPQNIIMPDFVGKRTANLNDESEIEVGGLNTSTGDETGESNRRRSGFIPVTPSTQYTISRKRETTTSYLWVLKYRSDKSYIGVITSVGDSSTFTTGDATAYIRWYTTPAVDYQSIMLNLGSTALPYEPYGYKIPITCAGQTTPVYLGQTQTVRRVRKLVLTGEETWYLYSAGVVHQFYSSGLKIGGIATTSAYSTIAPYGMTAINRNGDYGCYTVTSGTEIAFQMYRSKAEFPSQTEWKAYLAAQYAAGTPVTVWYVLAEPTTAIVNEPLCKIGDYADELHSTDAGVAIPTVKGDNVLTVDTPIQPSEMSITYKG